MNNPYLYERLARSQEADRLREAEIDRLLQKSQLVRPNVKFAQVVLVAIGIAATLSFVF